VRFAGLAVLLLVACAPERTRLLDPDDTRTMTLGQDGPFGVELVVRSVRIRVDETVDVDVMLPLDPEGEALANAPVVLFVQGGLVGRARYRWIGRHMASRGFAFVSPAHAFDIAFFQQGNALDVLASVRASSHRSQDALAGTLSDGPVAIIGHSLGGVVAATAWGGAPSTVSHLALLGSYPQESSFGQHPGARALSLLGTEDGRTSRDNATAGVRALETSGAPVTYALVEGMTHMQFADEVSTSEAADDGTPMVETAVARARLQVLLDALLESFAGREGSLLDAPSAWPLGLTPGPSR